MSFNRETNLCLASFDAAMGKVECDRPQSPAVYNVARLFEHPIPRFELSNNQIAGEQSNDEQAELQTTFFDSRELNASVEDVKPAIADEDLIALDYIIDHEIGLNEVDPLAIGDQHKNKNVNSSDHQVGENDMLTTSESFGNGIVHESSRINSVDVPTNLVGNNAIHGHSSDANIVAQNNEEVGVCQIVENVRLVEKNDAHDNSIGANVAAEMQKNDDENVRQIAENVQMVLLYGQKVTYDDEVEYISIPDQKLNAILDEPTYQVKVNDLLSGKIAFKQYVRSCIFHLSILKERF